MDQKQKKYQPYPPSNLWLVSMFCSATVPLFFAAKNYDFFGKPKAARVCRVAAALFLAFLLVVPWLLNIQVVGEWFTEDVSHGLKVALGFVPGFLIWHLQGKEYKAWQEKEKVTRKYLFLPILSGLLFVGLFMGSNYLSTQYFLQKQGISMSQVEAQFKAYFDQSAE